MSGARAVRPRAERLRWWEIAGGIVLPILASAGQILLLKEDTVGPWLTWGCAFVGIGALIAAAETGVNPVRRGLVCGANFGAAAGYALNTLGHLLYSYFFAWPAALVLICVPACAAAYVNMRRGLTLLEEGVLPWSTVALGAMAVFAPPAAAQFAEARWIAAIDKQMRADDANSVAAGVRALNRYPLRMGRFGVDVCEWVVIDRTDVWSNNAELVAELGKLLGSGFRHCEPRDPHG